jgi:hypothetical protein
MTPDVILVGNWLVRNNELIADEVCQEIEHLISTRLERVASREEDWTVLYIDPNDQSYWELTYPQSEMRGGGPPRQAKLSIESVRRAYPSLA